MAEYMAEERRRIGANLRTESLRLTAFLPPNERVREPTWWSDLTGAQPENRVSRPGTGELQDVGPFENRVLVLSHQPGRVDWVLTLPAPTPDDDPTEARSIGFFPEILNVFLPLMSRWLEKSPPVVRIAFGAVLLEPVPDKPSGYRRLSEFLQTVRIDPEGSEDFLYQINRPRTSALRIDNLVINRLSKWSVSLYQRLGLGFGLPSLQAIQSFSSAPLYACRIELDISTPAVSTGELTHGRLVELYRELVDLAVEITVSGDVP
jgi:hypothetical protein